MVVVRPEIQINEAEAILKLIAGAKPKKRSPLWLAEREIRRSYDRAKVMQRSEREHMRRIRAEAAERFEERERAGVYLGGLAPDQHAGGGRDD